jgi:hypothetical protein
VREVAVFAKDNFPVLGPSYCLVQSCAGFTRCVAELDVIVRAGIIALGKIADGVKLAGNGCRYAVHRVHPAKARLAMVRGVSWRKKNSRTSLRDCKSRGLPLWSQVLQTVFLGVGDFGLPLPTAALSHSGDGRCLPDISDISEFSFPSNAGTEGETVRIDVESARLSNDS